MRDFTVKIYVALLEGLKQGGYGSQTFREYMEGQTDRVIILRHDVDKMPQNSLSFAKIEHDIGIKASYYFRRLPQSFQREIIKEIASLGHEIGYHYEDLDLCGGDMNQAYRSFQSNLAKLRDISPVMTICMHGSPFSKHDNRDIWKKYDYRNDGIIGEPYFNLDFSKVLYLTDTGRSWNSSDTSIRDKVTSPFNYKINNTAHLIKLINEGKLPDQIMINTHPQRWNDNIFLWVRELVWQNSKNIVKRAITRIS